MCGRPPRPATHPSSAPAIASPITPWRSRFVPPRDLSREPAHGAPPGHTNSPRSPRRPRRDGDRRAPKRLPAPPPVPPPPRPPAPAHVLAPNSRAPRATAPITPRPALPPLSAPTQKIPWPSCPNHHRARRFLQPFLHVRLCLYPCPSPKSVVNKSPCPPLPRPSTDSFYA